MLSANEFILFAAILGDSGTLSMQLTSPEDQRAIKDIEKQLLFDTEILCPNKSFPGNDTSSEPHSPSFSQGKLVAAE